MPTALQLPFQDKAAQRVGQRLFRKQVLPVGTIPYKGRRLDFTRPYLERLAHSFTAGAYDQVPFLLANPANEHHSDPERYRGHVKGLEVADDGLYALIELTDQGAEIIGANPRLGVSARIIPDHAKGPAIEHVLGTLNPHVTGMKPWETVELAADTRLIDLTDAVFTLGMADGLTEQELAQLRDLVKRSERDQLQNLLKGTGTDTIGASGTSTSTTAASGTDETDPVLARAVEEFLAELNDGSGDGDGGTTGTETETETETAAALSAEARQAIELANTRAQDAQSTADQLKAQLAREQFQRERDRLVHDGVPPAMIDLAKPLLEQPVDVIELSNGSKVDPAEVVRKVLAEAKGIIDFTERGTGAGGDTDDEAVEARRLAEQMASKYDGHQPAKAGA